MKTIANMISMKDKRVLITGAGGNIGQKMAEVVVELGGDLILLDRLGSSLHELSINLKNIKKVNIECIFCDLEVEAERQKLISSLISMNINLNVLINNAAFVGDTKLEGWSTNFENQSINSWKRALEINLTSAFELSKGLSPLLKKTKNASIINISSIYSALGPDYSLYENTEMSNPAAYGVSKAGLNQLTRWLSTTLAPNIRVNTISPGGVFRNQPESFVKKYKQRTPLGRMATEDDFKGIVAYLASDLSLYTTGQNIFVDGGWTAW
jgi:NAD(P)-dependent dehydrogenase (short-subunit alcohol dehydrogenase family)